jgi:hypothetical protein
MKTGCGTDGEAHTRLQQRYPRPAVSTLFITSKFGSFRAFQGDISGYCKGFTTVFDTTIHRRVDGLLGQLV